MPSPVTRTQELMLEIPNEPGTLGEMAQLLGKEDINIVGFTAVATDSVGQLHLVTDDPKQAEEALEESGYVPRTREALVVTLPNEPGQLGRVANRLGTEGINIDASFITGSIDGSKLRCAFCVDDIEGAVDVLEGFLEG